MQALHITNTECGEENPSRSLLFFPVLGKSLKSLLGKRLTGQGKGNHQPIKIFVKFYNDTSQVACVLDFLLPVSLCGSLALL